MRTNARWIAPLLLTVVVGCGPSNGLNLAKVRGKVTFKGEPVTAGEIVFSPDESKGTKGPMALGTIGSDGSYTMSTEESGDGAIVGVHQVGIVGRDPKPLASGTTLTEGSSADDVLKVKASIGAPAKKGEGPTVRDRSGAVYRLLTPEKLKDPKSSSLSVKVDSGSNVKNIVIKEDGTATIE